MQQYVNLRPVRMMKGMKCPLAGRGPEDIDFWVIRENNEGEYSEIGGRLNRGTERAIAIQETVMTRHGPDRIMRYAFDLWRRVGKATVTSATQWNGIIHTRPFWDERFEARAAEYLELNDTKNTIQHPTPTF